VSEEKNIWEDVINEAIGFKKVLKDPIWGPSINNNISSEIRTYAEMHRTEADEHGNLIGENILKDINSFEHMTITKETIARIKETIDNNLQLIRSLGYYEHNHCPEYILEPYVTNLNRIVRYLESEVI